jgi:hypothetical protein
MRYTSFNLTLILRINVIIWLRQLSARERLQLGHEAPISLRKSVAELHKRMRMLVRSSRLPISFSQLHLPCLVRSAAPQPVTKAPNYLEMADYLQFRLKIYAMSH